MRIGVFGDIHGNLSALKAVLFNGKQAGVEKWVCLGDVAFRGPQPAECIDQIAALPDVIQIVGNTDQWLFQGFPAGFAPPAEKKQMLDAFREWTLQQITAHHLALLQAAPFSRKLTIGREEALFVHSSPASTEDWLPSSLSESEIAQAFTADASLVVTGHVHHPYVRRVCGRTIVNTGSTGHPTDGDKRASYLIIASDSGGFSLELRRIPYSWEQTVGAAKKSGMPYADDYVAALTKAVPL